MPTERVLEDSKPIKPSVLSAKAQGLELCECDGGSCVGDCSDCGSSDCASCEGCSGDCSGGDGGGSLHKKK